MGRLFKWIDRLSPSRTRVRRQGSRTIAVRRPLGFEQYESRLALSAAAQSALTLDGESFAAADMLQYLWSRAPGATDWGQVSFASVRTLTTPGSEDVRQIEFKINPVLLESGSEPSVEGGLIIFDSAITDYAIQMSSDGVSQSLVQAAFNANGQVQRFTSSAFAPGTTDGVTAPLVWNLYNAGASPALDLDSTTYTDLLGQTPDGPKVEGELHVDSSPVLRITVPLQPSESEGGTIDLTAMAGPTSLFMASPSASVAVRGAERSANAFPEMQASNRPVSASPIENLRARAVVYEVSITRDSERETPADVEPIERVPPPSDPPAPHAAAQSLQSSRAPHTHERGATLMPVVAESEATLSTPPANSPAPVTSSDETIKPSGDAARDAALSTWSDPPLLDAEDGDADDGAALAQSREQRIGLAVALIAGATPLIKRARRVKPPTAVEQSSGLV